MPSPPAALPPKLHAALVALLGEGGVLTGAEAMAPYLADWRGLMQGHALAALRPKDVAAVSAIMRLAQAYKMPVVVQGGKTGLVGGGLPFGGLVVSLEKLGHIRALDTINATLTLDAGVTLQAAQDAAAQAGRLFPLALASQGTCTIGGNIATNAGGTAVLRYGSMRDLVLGLEVVLANGDILNALSGLRKDNAGYDLKSLFIGSEGTLGIITAATLKLFPKPQSRLTGYAGAASPAAIVALFDRLRALCGERLTTFEILPRFGVEIVLKHCPGARDPLSEAHPFYALFELTAPEPDAPLAALTTSALGGALEAGEIADATLAASEAQAQAFWRIREALSECQRFEGGSIKHDLSVPISRIADFMVEVSALCEAAMPGIRVCAFGHIGDGNLHFNLSQPIGMEKAAFLAQWARFNTLVHDRVAAYHGSIAAEHGVGLFKRDALVHYKGAVAITLMKTLKRALDPANILNPGKVVALGAEAPEFTLPP